jgi:hypothetical protein
MKGACRQNAGKMSPVRRVGMDVRSRFNISRQTGRARDDAVVQMPSHQCCFCFIAPDRTVGDTAKRNSRAFDDAIVVRIEQNRGAGHGKIAVPPRIFPE